MSEPVAGTIVDVFRPPGCQWCAGNRGIEYRTQPGSAVVAAAFGAVSFYGMVAGTRYLVIRTPQGRRLTYGGIASSDLRVGDAVQAGESIAINGATLHFGVREGNTYVDPARYMSHYIFPTRRAHLVTGSQFVLTARRTEPVPSPGC